ncbi:MAG: hypothetical protein LBF02_02745 [Mycoplasmataceae bacterium]|nr:hypothetical protein [Mycoplasmataceae bacterium]
MTKNKKIASKLALWSIFLTIALLALLLGLFGSLIISQLKLSIGNMAHFSSFIVLLIVGIVLAFFSLIIIIVPIILYFFVRHNVKKEKKNKVLAIFLIIFGIIGILNIVGGILLLTDKEVKISK